MSSNSNNQGRAYEFAWMTSLFEVLNSLRQTEIEYNSSYDANKRAWNAIGKEKRALYTVSANAAVDTIIELEPMMEENAADKLILEFQKDELGEDEFGEFYIPFDYDPDKEYPVIFYLHSAGQPGSDNEKPVQAVICHTFNHKVPYVDDAILIVPQCPSNARWVDHDWGKGAYTAEI